MFINRVINVEIQEGNGSDQDFALFLPNLDYLPLTGTLATLTVNIFSKAAPPGLLFHNSRTKTTLPSYPFMTNRLALTFAIALLLGGFLFAQDASLSLLDFNQRELNHQKTAMLTLGGWAVANIGAGLALRGTTTGSAREFHTMNALWNTVNLGIAGLGYWSALKSDPANWDLATSLGKQQNFQKILLFNAGLDVGYLMGGLYLTERAKRPDVNSDQLKGFGNSIMLQGAFLMVFDLANYFIAAGRNGNLQLQLGATGQGVGLTWVF